MRLRADKRNVGRCGNGTCGADPPRNLSGMTDETPVGSGGGSSTSLRSNARSRCVSTGNDFRITAATFLDSRPGARILIWCTRLYLPFPHALNSFSRMHSGTTEVEIECFQQDGVWEHVNCYPISVILDCAHNSALTARPNLEREHVHRTFPIFKNLPGLPVDVQATPEDKPGETALLFHRGCVIIFACANPRAHADTEADAGLWLRRRAHISAASRSTPFRNNLILGSSWLQPWERTPSISEKTE
ncbi:hypothetical protein EDB86DRAFT_2916590 [Lactarius hatsudake]|nr:hypothetical protein EDB86DRAFT_2916590 [Lactarius hatsudake]